MNPYGPKAKKDQCLNTFSRCAEFSVRFRACAAPLSLFRRTCFRHVSYSTAGSRRFAAPTPASR